MSVDPRPAADLAATEAENTISLGMAAIGALADDLDRVTVERDRLAAEVAALSQQVEGVLGSSSWRVTAPLRAGAAWVRARRAPLGQLDDVASLPPARTIGPAGTRAPGSPLPAATFPSTLASPPGAPLPPGAGNPSRSVDASRVAEFEQRMAEAYAAMRPTFLTQTPISNTHKIWWRRLHDRRPVLHTLVDKVAVRDYVAERIGASYLTPVHAVLDTADGLVPDALPEHFVAKATHGSGGVAICWDGPSGASTDNPRWFREAHRPEDFPWADVRDRFAVLLDHDYGWDQLEWAYLGLPRRIIVEDLVRDPDGGLPTDYRISTYCGAPRLLACSRQLYGATTHHYLTLDWEPVRGATVGAGAVAPPPRPARLAEMLEIAAALSDGLDNARVDLYDGVDGVRFGEMTMYPNAGLGTYDPPQMNIVRGAFWQVPPMDVLRPG